MTDLPELSALYDRVCKTSGPDRALDYRIAYAMGWRFNGFEWNEQSRDQPSLSDEQFQDLDLMAGGWKRPDEPEWPDPDTNENRVPVWTGSQDAIAALIEQELPGWNISLFKRGSGGSEGWIARLRSPRWDVVAPHERDANGLWSVWRSPTGALALTVAYLAACIARHPAHAGIDG